MKLFSKISGYINERINLDSLKEYVGKKYVPIHRHSVWYYFGGVSLFLFFIQVVTGILLLFYYKGSAEHAYESVRFIMSKVEFGWLIRSIHAWSANLFILALFVHMFSVFFGKAYRKPREFTWLTGMVLFFLSLGFGFSGYLLPWNELAFFATKVGTKIVGALPYIGEPLLNFLRGGEDVTDITLSRFFGFHVALLPGVFTFVLVIHLFLIQKQGISEPMELAKEESVKQLPFFPNFLLRDILLWLIVLILIATLSVFFPAEVGIKADPFQSAPEGIKPEWYFLFMFQALKFIPGNLWIIDGDVFGVLFFSVCALLWILVPFIDRKSSRGEDNPAIKKIGIVIISAIVLLTIIGFLT